MLHVPQCCAFVFRSTHAPLHAVSPGAQLAAQCAWEHTPPSSVQSTVQLPQCCADERSVSHPFATFLSQSATPEAHPVTMQLSA